MDGVTFETAKWETVLDEMGHELRLCAGEVDALRYQARLVPPMHFTWPPAERVTAAAFDPESHPDAVRSEINRLADLLVPVLDDWASRNELDLVIVENAWAIPMHLPLGVALRRMIEERRLPAIGHHHDYWWERERFAGCVVPEVLEMAFPPDLPWVRHVSINSLAAAQLRERRGIRSTVIPNVFDFDRPRPRRAPAVRRRLRTELGMSERGLLVVQPTRVVPRKGIELAIELVGRLKDPDAVLLITSPGRRRGARLPGRAGAAGRAPQGAAGLRGRSLRSRPRGQADPARPLAPRRVPRRRPDHLSEPLRGLRQRPAGGDLLRRSRWS